MSPSPQTPSCEKSELIPLLAINALPADELRETKAHLAFCSECRQQLEALRQVTQAFVAWPTDILRPDPSLWDRVADRVSAESAIAPLPAAPVAELESSWGEAAPGIFCKLLTTDTERGRVSLLVRLAPGVDYPSHKHAEFEELHLLEGELWIGDRKLSPGDFNRSEPGSADTRVWSETGCTCFLTTSYRDILG